MKKAGSIFLLSLYMFSIVQMLVPLASFHLNHEYIKKHLCKSLTQPEFGDCDGFCYLKKQIDDHQDYDMDSHGTAAYVPKVPFVYLPEIRSRNIASPEFYKQSKRYLNNDSLPQDIFLDIISPPPKVSFFSTDLL